LLERIYQETTRQN